MYVSLIQCNGWILRIQINGAAQSVVLVMNSDNDNRIGAGDQE